ncbi:hypothetical protein ECANGB1_1016 [Enterospora canceri]|uniref:Uncharacterized protein n=1 Tax=Enterospora canceri TaxID=1081671 RepID=A0A1Y1S715_9MICR|nr:hypothetical protein ECANGB1_1016 [Enterospora canceri]
MDGSKFSMGNWNMAQIDVRRQMAVGEKHEHRLVLSTEEYFGFDDKLERDYWYATIKELQRQIKELHEKRMR